MRRQKIPARIRQQFLVGWMIDRFDADQVIVQVMMCFVHVFHKRQLGVGGSDDQPSSHDVNFSRQLRCSNRDALRLCLSQRRPSCDPGVCDGSALEQ